MDNYKPTKWWQVLDETGKLWCETSNEKEARDAMKPGHTLLRLYEKVQVQWRRVD
jgi:hypothetical protein